MSACDGWSASVGDGELTPWEGEAFCHCRCLELSGWRLVSFSIVFKFSDGLPSLCVPSMWPHGITSVSPKSDGSWAHQLGVALPRT